MLLWGYDSTNSDGELVESWIENTCMQLELIHNAKLPKSFNSCCWRRGYNPDLCFFSRRLAHLSEKAVLNPLPKSQHRPISVTIKPAITKSKVPFQRCFNLKKAKWAEYNKGMEKALLDVEPTPDNYSMFVQAHIPRGWRKEYIAGLTEESLQLLECYETEFGNDPFSDTTSELGDALMESLGKDRRKTWQDLIENINMTQNSKKAWSTIRKLNGDKITPRTISDITPNQVGSQLVANGRRAERRRAKGKHHSTITPGNQQNMSILTKPFTLEEFEAGLRTMKLGKAAAYDTVQHRLLIKKLFDMAADAKLCNVIRCLLSNWMFYVTFNNRKSRWFHQTNGLPQGSVLTSLLFNVYTNDQPLPEGCSRAVITKAERTKQANDNRHSLHEHSAAQKRLSSRSSFLDTTEVLETRIDARITEWQNQWNSLGSQTTQWMERGITPDECLATG
ncbi:hypothetical protein AAFF_G00066130 [Aldrovandia affinis]|uniref:Reverse transcriptase domain-containing protein n=1 Tax=Aldrovandia affinis TaxID=143900 RepID=A0AAD7WYU1_9TELE|nr:hypothetical protein AAFF_G00066130 [Aldrovandia affinis]